MSEDKFGKELAEFLRENKPLFKEVMDEADSDNDRPHKIIEFSSFSEISRYVIEETELLSCGKERLQRVIRFMVQAGLMEIEEFDEEIGYLRCKMFLPVSDFDDLKN